MLVGDCWSLVLIRCLCGTCYFCCSLLTGALHPDGMNLDLLGIVHVLSAPVVFKVVDESLVSTLTFLCSLTNKSQITRLASARDRKALFDQRCNSKIHSYKWRNSEVTERSIEGILPAITASQALLIDVGEKANSADDGGRNSRLEEISI